MAAYALARLQFFGVGGLGTAIFVTYLVPTSLLFLPLAQVVNWLGLGDSKWALVVTYPTFLVPFCTWLLMGYFRTVPKEVEECAMVDGATRLQALWRIVLPIAVPGLVCAALFAFTLSWNEFIYALTFTSSSDEITASVGITSELIRGDIYFWGSLMAGADARLRPHRHPLRLLPRLLRLRPHRGRAEVAGARAPRRSSRPMP